MKIRDHISTFKHGENSQAVSSDQQTRLLKTLVLCKLFGKKTKHKTKIKKINLKEYTFNLSFGPTNFFKVNILFILTFDISFT